jgi:hypothetical protein
MKTICAIAPIVIVWLALSTSGCGSSDNDKTDANKTASTPTAPTAGSKLPQGSEPVDLDPADFTKKIDNPYWPMTPDGKAGRHWVYRGTEAGESITVNVTVTNRKKVVDGVQALAVLDVVTGRSGLIERTYDWYGQDSAGNIWYLGEDTEEYENGKVSSTSGSWEAGVDGAQAGIIVPAKPRVGLAYRQEYYKGEAEDQARVAALDATAKVPFGSFTGCLKTRDTTPLEPKNAEFKYYAKGVGPVLKTAESGAGREELISFRRPK